MGMNSFTLKQIFTKEMGGFAISLIGFPFIPLNWTSDL